MRESCTLRGRNKDTYSDMVYSYDQSWINGGGSGPLANQERFLTALNWGGKIYLVGGFDGTDISALLNHTSHQESSLVKPCNQETLSTRTCIHCKAEQLIDTLFVLCPIYDETDPDGSKWILETIPESFLLGKGFATANFNNNLYIMGGINSIGQATSFFGKFQALYSIVLPILTNQ